MEGAGVAKPTAGDLLLSLIVQTFGSTLNIPDMAPLFSGPAFQQFTARKPGCAFASTVNEIIILTECTR